MDFTQKIDRHEALLETLEEYSDILDGNSDVDVRRELRNTIGFLEVSQEFGIDFGKVFGYHHMNFEVNQHTRFMKGAHISWSDDGRQPSEDEYLYVISFPTGAYIFGQHYPTQLFQEFFHELRSYKPKYLDSANKTLYFDSSNAKEIHRDFPKILKKYQDRVKDDYKRIRKEQLEEELRQLEDN